MREKESLARHLEFNLGVTVSPCHDGLTGDFNVSGRVPSDVLNREVRNFYEGKGYVPVLGHFGTLRFVGKGSIIVPTQTFLSTAAGHRLTILDILDKGEYN